MAVVGGTRAGARICCTALPQFAAAATTDRNCGTLLTTLQGGAPTTYAYEAARDATGTRPPRPPYLSGERTGKQQEQRRRGKTPAEEAAGGRRGHAAP